jgi:sulfur relay (sulfurtransferase) DsrC/TusE family protein
MSRYLHPFHDLPLHQTSHFIAKYTRVSAVLPLPRRPQLMRPDHPECGATHRLARLIPEHPVALTQRMAGRPKGLDCRTSAFPSRCS